MRSEAWRVPVPLIGTEMVSAVPVQLSCPICLRVMLPDDLSTCNHGHSFCESCIQRWLDRQSTCPIDRAQLVRADLSPNFLARSLLTCVHVRCPSSSCTWTGTPAHLRVHEERCEHVHNPGCAVGANRYDEDDAGDGGSIFEGFACLRMSHIYRMVDVLLQRSDQVTLERTFHWSIGADSLMNLDLNGSVRSQEFDLAGQQFQLEVLRKADSFSVYVILIQRLCVYRVVKFKFKVAGVTGWTPECELLCTKSSFGDGRGLDNVIPVRHLEQAKVDRIALKVRIAIGPERTPIKLKSA